LRQPNGSRKQSLDAPFSSVLFPFRSRRFGKKIASPAQTNRISKTGLYQPRLQLEAAPSLEESIHTAHTLPSVVFATVPLPFRRHYQGPEDLPLGHCIPLLGLVSRPWPPRLSPGKRGREKANQESRSRPQYLRRSRRQKGSPRPGPGG